MVYDTIVLTFALLVVIVILGSLAARIQVPYAVVLVGGGMILGFIPGLPRVVLDPDLVLLLFLPPLIYSSAWFTSWQSFRRALLPIFLQAIGLVLVTTILVAVIAHALRPSLPWSVAFVLGAIVSPTDAVAAGTIMQGVGLSHQISIIIEGESLVNDATSLVAYRLGVEAVSGGSFSLWGACLQFLFVSIGGALLGLVLAFPVAKLHTRINDTPSQITLMVATPFATYLLAEALGVSGVLATVTAGLYLGRQSAIFFSANTRLQADSFWNVVVFLFNGLIFLLIGLQLRTVVEQIHNSSLLFLVGYGLVVSLTVIAVRIAWSFAANSLLRSLKFFYGRRPASRRAVTVISWAGMRGGVSLATALALPETLGNGTAFPERDLVIFVTFVVIFVTLVFQGLTFAPLIRAMHLGNDPDIGREAIVALQKATEAALRKIDELAKDYQDSEELVKHVRSYYERKLGLVNESLDTDRDREKYRINRGNYKQLLLDIHQEERQVLIDLRNEGNLDDTVFHRMERDFDLEEERLEGR